MSEQDYVLVSHAAAAAAFRDLLTLSMNPAGQDIHTLVLEFGLGHISVLPADIPALALRSVEEIASAHRLQRPVQTRAVLVPTPVGVPAVHGQRSFGRFLRRSGRGEKAAHDRCPSTSPRKIHTAAALAPCPGEPIDRSASISYTL